MNTQKPIKQGFRFLTLLICLLAFSPMKADEVNIVSLEAPAKIQPGQTFLLALDVENQSEFMAFEAHILIPEGFTPVENPEEESEWWSSDRVNLKNHTFAGKWHPETRELVLLCYSVELKLIKGNNGAVCYVSLKAADNIAEGQYSFDFTGKKVVLDNNSVGIPCEMESCTVTIDNTSHIQDVVVEVNPENVGESDAFNVMGQKVDDTYTGIVVKKGEKTLRTNR